MDEELALLAGRYTPQMQETMVRLGSKMPFAEAVQEVWHSRRTHVSATTLRRLTYRVGRAAEALVHQKVEELQREAPAVEAAPEKLVISADGTFIRLISGEWREVKSVALGEFETVWRAKKGELEVKSRDISYFSRSYRVREFERYALEEMQRRGLHNAQTVVAVNDGAEWIQSFLDYHCPQAVRIIDFAHTLGYLSDAAKAIWGEGTEACQAWFKGAAQRLKHKPPPQTVANLRLLAQKAKNEEQEAEVDRALLYIQTRSEMMDYPHFQKRGYPIGSGSVESGHKVVTHRRLKGAGMRWAEHHVDPMLALRDLLCNDRWEEGWQETVTHQQEQRWTTRLQKANEKRPPPSAPVTFAMLEAAGLLPVEDPSDQPPANDEPLTEDNKPWRPAADHPWRNDKWPTREAWRWN